MSGFIVERASAAPAGVSVVLGRRETYRRALLVRAPNFMLEDVVDAALAKLALKNATEGDRLSWERVKEDLGLL